MIDNDKIALESGCYFDETQANRAVKFLETYTFIPELGAKITLLPWQWDFVRRLYGRRRTGRLLQHCGDVLVLSRSAKDDLQKYNHFV